MAGEAARFIGTMPEFYDRELGPVIFEHYADDFARRVASCGAERILEVAAGTGIVTRRLRDALPATARLTASDLNPPMLDVARAKFDVSEQVEFQPADAMALPFPDTSFDAVVCQFGVMFFPDKNEAYREVHRVLAPGGRYFFNVWDSHRYNPFGRIAHETISRLFPNDPPQFYAVPFGYHRIDPIKDSLIDAGFTDISIAALASERELNIAAFAHGNVYGNPVADQIRMRGGITPEHFLTQLVDAYTREFGTPARMPLKAFVFEATKR